MVSILGQRPAARRPFFVGRWRRTSCEFEVPRKGKGTDEAYLSAEQPAAEADPRLSRPHGDSGWTKYLEAPPAERAQAAHGANSTQTRAPLARRVRSSRIGNTTDAPYGRRLTVRGQENPVARAPEARVGSTANVTQAFGFGKDIRVRARRDFLRIQKRGRKSHSANFVVLSTAQVPPRTSRFGFSVSRRVGNAVERNRLKRRLRELCRLHRREFAAARDFVLIAKPGAAGLSYAEIIRELRAPLSA